MAGDTISTTITKEIFLGTGAYLNPLSVTSAGRIAVPAPNTGFQNAAAIYANLISGSIVNRGVISGAIPATDSYTAPAIFSTNPLYVSNYGSIIGQSGIYLQDGGTIANGGSIAGMEAATAGGYGVRLDGAELANTGSVYGKRYGAADRSGLVTNAGTIAGETAGISLGYTAAGAGATLSNTGTILGGTAGVTETSALILNSGSIAGQTYGLRVSWGGSIANTGQISAGVDGVLLLNEQYRAKYATRLTNSGSIQGGYFGLAINFAYATNAASGLVSGTQFGAGVGDSAYLYNAGTVYGVQGALEIESGGLATNAGSVASNGIGVQLFSNGVFTNASAGHVYGHGTAALNQAAYLVNAGSIGANVYGVELLSGGIAVNSGAIAAQEQGVYLSALSATSSPDFLGNTGTIYGLELGVNLRDGTAFNAGTIDALQNAVSMAGSTSFINSGEVYGGRYGVQLLGGSVLNTGAIAGKTDGIRLTHGYVANSGTVTGGKYAIYGTSFALTIDPGAVFNGNVIDKTKTSTLNLGGVTPGTLSGLGAQFNAFNTIHFDPGADWLISGTTAALAARQVISGFEQGDTILLTGFSASSDSFVTNSGLKLVSGSTTETVDITGSFATGNFSVTSSGTLTTIKLNASAPCFTAGTRILTARGQIPVEQLAVGDTVITLGGADRPIIWIGHRKVDLARHPRPAEIRPVCIAANALADEVPQRDLWLSPDHALLIDGLLIPARLLLNGLNIRAAGGASTVTYYHLELDCHSVLFAENAPAESYLETGNRNAFENSKGELLLHPDFSALLRQQNACFPMVLEGEALEAIRRRVLQRYTPNRRRSNA